MKKLSILFCFVACTMYPGIIMYEIKDGKKIYTLDMTANLYAKGAGSFSAGIGIVNLKEDFCAELAKERARNINDEWSNVIRNIIKKGRALKFFEGLERVVTNRTADKPGAFNQEFLSELDLAASKVAEKYQLGQACRIYPRW